MPYANENIMKGLNNKFNKALLEFLAFTLGRLTSLNVLFQSSVPLLHHRRREVTSVVFAMCYDFMVNKICII